MRTVVETGDPQIVPALGETSKGRKKTAILGGINARSAICVPLQARKRTLGALTLVRTDSSEVYGADDLALVEDLAGRIALAIDRGRLYREVEERADAARVVAHVADGVLLVDRAGVVRLWNPAAEAITSVAAADVLGNSAADVIPGWKDAVGLGPGLDLARSRPCRGRHPVRDRRGRALDLDLRRELLRRNRLRVPRPDGDA